MEFFISVVVDTSVIDTYRENPAKRPRCLLSSKHIQIIFYIMNFNNIAFELTSVGGRRPFVMSDTVFSIYTTKEFVNDISNEHRMVF